MINQITREFDKTYIKAMKQLEQYAQYSLRCLHRANIHPAPTEFAFLTIERDNGTIAQAVAYPLESCVDGEGVVNPMFFYGFKFDYDFRDLTYPFKITFTESYDELIK